MITQCTFANLVTKNSKEGRNWNVTQEHFIGKKVLVVYVGKSLGGSNITWQVVTLKVRIKDISVSFVRKDSSARTSCATTRISTLVTNPTSVGWLRAGAVTHVLILATEANMKYYVGSAMINTFQISNFPIHSS